MATVAASTTDTRKVTLDIAVSGMPMSAMEAQQFARHVQQSCTYHLGTEEDNLTVNVTADSAPAAEEEEEAPEEEATVEPATAEEIKAMSPDEFKAAKAAGRIPARMSL